MDIKNAQQLKDLYSAAIEHNSEDAKKMLEDYAVDITGLLVNLQEKLNGLKNTYLADAENAQKEGNEGTAQSSKLAAEFIDSLLEAK